MPALTKRENKPYVQIFDGKFVSRVNENEPGAVSRVNKNDKVVWELHYDGWEGMLEDISCDEDGKFGKELVVQMEDVKIFAPWSGRHTKQLLNRLPNVDPTKPVALVPYKFTPDDEPNKIISGWNVEQDGKKVDMAFERDDVPPMEQIEVKGNLVWDDTEQLKFLEEQSLEKWIALLHETRPNPLDEVTEDAPEGKEPW